MKLEYIVKEKDDNVFLKTVLEEKLLMSSTLIKEVITKGLVLQNGINCFLKNRVKSGDAITVNLDNTYDKKEIDGTHGKYNPWKHELDIIYEDEWIFCINKQAGIPCHPSVGHNEHTLYQAIMQHYLQNGEMRPVHIVTRLDKNTSGVVIIAKHKYIQELFTNMMKQDLIYKEYLAVVHGKFTKSRGVIEKNIFRKADSIILRKTTNSTKKGQYAKTEYEVISYNKQNDTSVLKVILHTGRTHQIRVHMASIGHPIVGDDLYIKEYGYDFQDNISRQALHAKKIIMPDLFNYVYYRNSDKICKIEALLPSDISEIM